MLLSRRLPTTTISVIYTALCLVACTLIYVVVVDQYTVGNWLLAGVEIKKFNSLARGTSSLNMLVIPMKYH